MSWNWQQPNWPLFAWHQARLAPAEGRFLLELGTFLGVTKHLDGDESRPTHTHRPRRHHPAQTQVLIRQEKALLRMLREGPEGFAGGLSAANYSTITGASPATATRDLAGLVSHHALAREGDRRHARYHLAIALPQ